MAEVLDLEEKRLEKLAPRELAGHLMMLPVKKRLDFILRRADAKSVVAALGVHDFYFSVQEIGPDDSLPFLALADVEQLNHLFDLEWWEKDGLQASNAIAWLGRLERASEHNLLAWLYTADFELLVALFKKWIRVAVAEEDVDPMEARDQLPPNTVDDVYFWETLYPQYEELLTRVLNLLFDVNQGFYRELMNHVIWRGDSVMEEEAYHFHRARLEDDSIPDFYEALEIYRSISPGEIVAVEKTPDSTGEDASAPSFALALVPEGEILGKTLAAIEDPALLHMLQFELASLANKVVVADRLSPGSPAALRDAVAKAAAYVNLGLELVASGDGETATRALGSVYLEHLFRLAHARIARVRTRFDRIVRSGWLSQWPEGIKCLDREWMEQAELLLAKTPMLLRRRPGNASASEGDYIRTREDLKRAGRFVRTIERLSVPYAALRPQPGTIEKDLLPDSQIPGLADVTLGAMILTAAGQFLLNREWTPQPIPISRWPVLFPLVQPAALRKIIVDWVRTLPVEGSGNSPVMDYVDSILNVYAEEIRAFSETNLPEPRVAGFFLFTNR